MRPVTSRSALQRPGRRRFLALLGSAPVAALGAACLGSQDPPVRVTVDGGTPAPTGTPRVVATTAGPAAIPFVPTSPPSDLDPDDLHGFVMPLEGACFPANDNLMPNAPREYRSGVHEGLDFYWGDSCILIERGTPVVASYAGVVVRADHHYVDLTLDQARTLEVKTEEQGFSDPETLDTYRGRQVWVDHGNGVVTRYCHLHRVEPDLGEGSRVEAGQRLGSVGESGTPESVTAPGTQLHLHWEVRVGEGFLGQDLAPEDVRAVYQRLMQPA